MCGMSLAEYLVTPVDEIRAIETAYNDIKTSDRSWDAYMLANIFNLFGVKKKTQDFLPAATVDKQASEEDKVARIKTLGASLKALGFGHTIN